MAKPASSGGGLQPLVPRTAGTAPTAAPRKSGRFARLPTEPVPGDPVSIAHQSYASISVTDYSAVSVA